MEWSNKSEINLSVIAVQMPEDLETPVIIDKRKLMSLSDICSERIKRASKKVKKENPKTEADLGFKIFKLTNSNYKPWKNYEGLSVEELEKQFSLFTTPLVDGWKADDLLQEVLLLEGFPLDSKIELQNDFKKNKVHQASSDFCEHKLHVCLDKKIAPETIANLNLGDGDIFICLDSAITDEEKVRLADKGLIKTI